MVPAQTFASRSRSDAARTTSVSPVACLPGAEHGAGLAVIEAIGGLPARDYLSAARRHKRTLAAIELAAYRATGPITAA